MNKGPRNPMIPLKYLPKKQRWVDKKSNVSKYSSFFSDTIDKLNEALPLSNKAKTYYIQGLAVIETKAKYNILDQRCWVTTSDAQPPKIYEDSGQNV